LEGGHGSGCEQASVIRSMCAWMWRVGREVEEAGEGLWFGELWLHRAGGRALARSLMVVFKFSHLCWMAARMRVQSPRRCAGWEDGMMIWVACAGSG
jgi:hypothetical protein